jgi:hypothetical protein
VKVGDLVKPSEAWEGHRFHNEEDFGVGVVIDRVEECAYGRPQSHIMWSTEDAYNSWEYDYELEVINEGR